jgi:hypothetical protein
LLGDSRGGRIGGGCRRGFGNSGLGEVLGGLLRLLGEVLRCHSHVLVAERLEDLDEFVVALVDVCVRGELLFFLRKGVACLKSPPLAEPTISSSTFPTFSRRSRSSGEYSMRSLLSLNFISTALMRENLSSRLATKLWSARTIF